MEKKIMTAEEARQIANQKLISDEIFEKLINDIANKISESAEEGKYIVILDELTGEERFYFSRIEETFKNLGYEVKYQYPDMWQNESEKYLTISWL